MYAAEEVTHHECSSLNPLSIAYNSLVVAAVQIAELLSLGVVLDSMLKLPPFTYGTVGHV